MIYFTARDLSESALAIACFVPLLLVPGYTAGWGADVAHFRRLGRLERAAWSLPLGFGLGTLLMVWISSLFSLELAAIFYYLLVACGVGWLAWHWRRDGSAFFSLPRDRYSRWAIAACVFWCVAALLQLVDLQWGHRLFVPVTVRDHCYRTAFIESVLRSGVPPTNPLYDTGHPALMRNYYFLYVICGVVCKATGLAARDVLIASCVWAGIGMFCVAALFCKYFLPIRTKLRRTALLSTLLFGATGLDILMVVYLHFSTSFHRFDADMEWWDPDHWPSWLDSFLYVPHHVASLVCCLVALLLLWTARTETNAWARWSAAALAAIAFTSAFGLSIYVAFAFAITIMIWAVVLLFEKQRQLVWSIAVSGFAAAILLIPFLLQLRGETEATGSKTKFPLIPQLRQLYGLNEWAASLAAHHPWALAHAKIVRTLLWFVLVVPDISLELGFFGLCGVLALWHWRRGRFAGHSGVRTLLVLLGGSLFSTLCVRSSVTTINDYGMRTAMLPLFLLLIFAAYYVSEGLVPLLARHVSRLTTDSSSRPRLLQTTATVLLALGVIGTIYQAMGIRFFLPLYEAGRLRDHRTNGAFPEMSRHVYQLREAYKQLARIAPASSVVQYNPESIGSYFLYVNMLNVDHQVVAAEPGCGKSFGGDASACPIIEEALAALYDEPAADARTAASICRSLGINYLVVTDQDPAWQDSDSWVWSGHVAVSEPDLRILACR